LQTSIINGPTFFGLENDYGSVSVGKAADLLLLEKNPLEDIRNTRSIRTVVQGAEIYDQNRLKDLLESIRKN
jgi:imidazolonepropionase-like amidohydrolase